MPFRRERQLYPARYFIEFKIESPVNFEIIAVNLDQTSGFP